MVPPPSIVTSQSSRRYAKKQRKNHKNIIIFSVVSIHTDSKFFHLTRFIRVTRFEFTIHFQALKYVFGVVRIIVYIYIYINTDHIKYFVPSSAKNYVTPMVVSIAIALLIVIFYPF